DKSPKGFLPETPALVPSALDHSRLRWRTVGATNPSYWALECRKRMLRYGTTDEDLADIKVILSGHGCMNPRARYRKVVTREEVVNTGVGGEPVRVVEICATSDGAAAVVVCSQDFASRHTGKPVQLRAVSIADSEYGDPTIRIPFVSAPVNERGTPHSEIAC